MTQDEIDAALRERRVLRASVDECRRVLQQELDEGHRQREVTARILNVGIAILAGAIAVVGLMVRLDIALPVPVYTGIAVAVGLNTLGTAETAFLLSGARHRPQWAFGPDLAGLDARLDDPDWREDDLNRSLVRSYVGASGLNLEGIARLVIGRRSALGKLALSVIGYLGAFAYILARGI